MNLSFLTHAHPLICRFHLLEHSKTFQVYLMSELRFPHILNFSPDDSEVVVEDAWEAELRHKVHLESLGFIVQSDDIYSSVSLNAIDALETHRYLNELVIENYMGSRLSDWVVSK
ncbi:hypothetical protein MIMGU_mgv11b015325mg [Erythranthe guttata]|uniref:R13L1/DRL21-like LRR repeat region domain-containing protein n=1 Tax=Erythranthe guttata TaxID=4155 RepID=A0A022R3X7_ERYGU|nr:hypothetical protein MIMGU_mgv11b015325mg [Erythranthe guttata]